MSNEPQWCHAHVVHPFERQRWEKITMFTTLKMKGDSAVMTQQHCATVMRVKLSRTPAGGWKDDVCFLFSDREQRETSCSSRERFIMLAVLLYGLGSPLLALAIGLVLFWGFVDLLDFCNLAHTATVLGRFDQAFCVYYILVYS